MQFEILIVLWFSAFAVSSTSEIDKAIECNEIEATSRGRENCDISDYNKYVTCLRKRWKRDAPCNPACDGDDCSSDNCSDCDCDSCGTCDNSYCTNNCCSSCCPNRCVTHLCCHKVCRSQCRTSSCRSSCKKSCENDLPSKQSSYSSNIKNAIDLKSGHNITTVIHLNNLINNTNLIDVPINLNQSNINNITLNMDEYQQSQSQTGNCCSVISPRQCVPTQEYPFRECFHYRSKECGSVCRSPIMHVEPHRICDVAPQGPPKCHEQLMYIPQPQPRCTYKSVWPYVQCGLQGMSSCQGCYGQYGGSQGTSNCPSTCYDDFGSGPLYRQGPLLQPQVFGGSPFMGAGMGAGMPGAGMGVGLENFEMSSNMDFSNRYGRDQDKVLKIWETESKPIQTKALQN